MVTLEDFNVKRHSFDLSTGTHVVLFNRPKMPIHMLTTFIAGSRFDPIGKEGLAHFFEHMILAGTKKFPTKDMLAGFIEDLGGSVGASTGFDKLDINISLGDAVDTEYGIKLLAEILLNPLFDEKTIEKERGAILRELESYRSNPSRTLGEITRPLVFQNTPIGRSTLGSQESIKSITKEDIVAFHQQVIKGCLATIVIAGDLDSDNLKSLLEKHLLLPKGERPNFENKLPVYRDKTTNYVYFKNESLETRLSFRTPSIMEEDTIALNILGSILAGGRTGVLKKRLRYEKGLVYSVSAVNSSFVDGGMFNITTSVDKLKLQEVLDTICIELKRIANDGPLVEELQLVKNRLIKSIKTPMQTSRSWVETHDYRDLYYPHGTWTVEDYLKGVDSTTIEDIKRVTAKYFIATNWYLALTGAIDDTFIQGIKINL
jgi:predicted Zn-dependent peptidase